MTCEATSGPTSPGAPPAKQQTLPGEGWHVPHTGPDRTMQWAGNLGGGARTEAPPDTTSHIFIQQMDGYGDTRTGQQPVSINKRHGDSRGPVPAQPHINNGTVLSQRGDGRRGSRLHCLGRPGTDTQHCRDTNHRGQRPLPSPVTHTTFPLEAL